MRLDIGRYGRPQPSRLEGNSDIKPAGNTVGVFRASGPLIMVANSVRRARGVWSPSTPA
jgi:hypothetical protein